MSARPRESSWCAPHAPAAWSVSCETATHFLALCAEDVERLGVLAECAPVMRGPANRERLWDFVAQDPGAIVASDHAPAPWSLKQGSDFFAAWGGVSSCQSTLAVLLEGVGRGRLSLAAAVAAVRQPRQALRLCAQGRDRGRP